MYRVPVAPVSLPYTLFCMRSLFYPIRKSQLYGNFHIGYLYKYERERERETLSLPLSHITHFHQEHYNMSSAPRGGRLTLKGGISLKSKKDGKKKKKKKKKARTKRKDREEPARPAGGDGAGARPDGESNKRPRVGATEDGGDLPPGFTKTSGAGRILTSGSTVYGKGTRFFKDAAVGDALMVRHPASLACETRVIKMILSDESLALSSAFPQTLYPTRLFTC